MMRHRGKSRTVAFVAALIVTAIHAGQAIAQTANSNAGLQGGQDHLFDAILGTPNRKTPVPQDSNLATAPRAAQTAPTPQSKTKPIRTAPVKNRISRRGHQ